MSGALVKTNPFMEHGDLGQQVAAVRGLQEWVRHAGAEEAAEASDTARKARDVIKVLDGAEELAREATRLELMALRRLGQLKQDALAGKQRASAARGFASMSEDDFDRVVAEAQAWRSALAIWREINRQRDDERWRDVGRRIADGEACAPREIEPRDLKRLADSASALLYTYTQSGQPFSVSGLADEIADDFGYDRYDACVKEGLREVVRLAMQSDSALTTASTEGPVYAENPAGAPPFVTYYEDAGGWVRIPWKAASMEQLRFMVELRELQAEQMRAAAAHLRLLHDSLRCAEGAGCAERFLNLDFDQQNALADGAASASAGGVAA